MTKLVISVLLVFFSFTGFIDTAYSKRVYFEGVVVREKVFSNGFPVTVTVELIEPIKGPRAKDSEWFGSWREAHQKNIVGRFQITVGGKNIYVPFSVFADLASLHSLSVEETDKGGLIRIKGGSAGSSYRALIEFNERHVFRKKTYLAEFPDEAWEETRYSIVTGDR